MKHRLLVLLILAVVSWGGVAQALLIDFETLPDLTPVEDFYSGLYFENSIALTAGFSLNEIDYPPSSGVMAVGDDGGPLGILFDTPVEDISWYSTYGSQLTYSAYDIGGGLLYSSLSATGSNLGSSDLFFLDLAGISALYISGELPNSFIIDDLSFSPLVPGVPEPSTLILLGSGVAGLLLRRVRKAV